MRHANGLRKFSRTAAHRRSLLRNLATSFLMKEKFETTVQKAKEIRPVVEKLITLGKEDTLTSRRQAYGYLLNKDVVHKLFTDIGPRCKARNGGYTRVVRTRVRPGDAAEMAIIEMVDKADASAKKVSTKKASAKKSDSSAAAA